MYICLCRAITDDEIKQAISSGSNCVEALQHELGVSTQCGQCLESVQEILHQYLMDEIPNQAQACFLPVVLKQS